MTDAPKPPKGTPIRRTSGHVEGESRVVASLPTEAQAKSRAATLDKRNTASAPAGLRTVKAMEGTLGENRRVMANIEGMMTEGVLGTTADPNPLYRVVDSKSAANRNLASNHSSKEAVRKMQASASFSTAMAQFGIEPEFDNYDTLDIMAQQLIELLQSNVYGFANLTKYERNILYRYFHRTNPVIGRIMDLHTDLPLSKARLQAPQDVPEIVRDFVMQFFERIFAKLNVNEILREMVLAHYIYGEAFIQVDDFYNAESDRILQDISHLEEKVYQHDPENLRFLQTVEKNYSANPLSISLKDRFKYLETKFSNFYDGKYSGPEKLTVLQFYNVREYLENPDIDFEAIRYNVSDSFKRLVDLGYTPAQMIDLGYSQGFMELHALSTEPDCYVIDNDIYSGLPFLFAFRRADSTSLILRVLNQCIEWDTAQRSIKSKVANLGKMERAARTGVLPAIRNDYRGRGNRRRGASYPSGIPDDAGSIPAALF